MLFTQHLQSDAVGLYTGSTWDGLPTAIMWISPVACLTRMLLIPFCIQMLKLGNVTGAVHLKKKIKKIITVLAPYGMLKC
jgi:hypothetical protein